MAYRDVGAAFEPSQAWRRGRHRRGLQAGWAVMIPLVTIRATGIAVTNAVQARPQSCVLRERELSELPAALLRCKVFRC